MTTVRFPYAAGLLFATACGTPMDIPAQTAQETLPSSIATQEEQASSTEAATPEESAGVHERAVIRDHRLQPGGTLTPSTTPAVTGPNTLAPGTAAPFGHTLALPDRYQAPTPNLTMVANGLRLMQKSVSTLVTTAPNLPVTQPVEISIGYYSPAGNQRITQSYVRSTGNRFLYNDKEGDGQPRTLRIVITLSEPKAGGGAETFAITWPTQIEPLYDVAIGSFAFDLISKCDAVGKSEILFTWHSPDRQYHKYRFSTRAGSRTMIAPFAWTRQEVSWSQPLFREQAEFFDEDNAATEMLWACLPSGCGFSVTAFNSNHLLTGKTQLAKGNLKAHNDDCQAYYEYQITKTLRWYPSLDGR